MEDDVEYRLQGGLVRSRVDHGFIYGLFDKRDAGLIRYVGQTMYLVDRWHRHKSDALNPKSKSYDLPSARWIRKIGTANVNMKPLYYVHLDHIDEAEVYFITKHSSSGKLLNLSPGGKGGLRGVPRSIETKAKISLAQKGRARPEIAGEKHPNYGKTLLQGDQIVQAIALRSEGKSIKYISEKFGVSSTAVRNVLKGNDPSLGLRTLNKGLLLEGLKKCSQCFVVKSLQDYCNDKSKPSGRHSICKSCTVRKP